MLELFLEGNFTDTFEVSPAIVENAGAFAVAVKNARFGTENKKTKLYKSRILYFFRVSLTGGSTMRRYTTRILR